VKNVLISITIAVISNLATWMITSYYYETVVIPKLLAPTSHAVRMANNSVSPADDPAPWNTLVYNYEPNQRYTIIANAGIPIRICFDVGETIVNIANVSTDPEWKVESGTYTTMKGVNIPYISIEPGLVAINEKYRNSIPDPITVTTSRRTYKLVLLRDASLSPGHPIKWVRFK